MWEKFEKFDITKKVAKMKQCLLQNFQEVAGKIQHASFGIPVLKWLFYPIHKATKTIKKFIKSTQII